MHSPKIHVISILRQVISEKREVFSVIREAISNSKDAGATAVSINVEHQNQRLNLEIIDNGEGMSRKDLPNFFGLGFSDKKRTEDVIGEKGLGTKLYFNSDFVEVWTKPTNGKRGYYCKLESPIESLEKNVLPNYQIKWIKETEKQEQGTKIKISALATSSARDFIYGEKLKNYIQWNTAAGNISYLFGKKQKFTVSVAIANTLNKFNVSRHEIPADNRLESFDRGRHPDSYAARFKPFCVILNRYTKPVKVEIAGAIVGSEGHIIKDKRIKKKYKGMFLAKDYMIVKDINEDIFRGSGEWQSMHIVVNCQKLELGMGRDNFINTGGGSVYAEVVECLKSFVNSIKVGQPFIFKGVSYENGETCAGKLYTELSKLKEEYSNFQKELEQSIELASLNERPLLNSRLKLPFSFEPVCDFSTLALFVSLIGKRIRGMPKIKIISFNNGANGLAIRVIQRPSKTGRWSKPLHLKVVHSLSQQDSIGKYDGAIFWKGNHKSKIFYRLCDLIG